MKKTKTALDYQKELDSELLLTVLEIVEEIRKNNPHSPVVRMFDTEDIRRRKDEVEKEQKAASVAEQGREPLPNP